MRSKLWFKPPNHPTYEQDLQPSNKSSRDAPKGAQMPLLSQGQKEFVLFHAIRRELRQS